MPRPPDVRWSAAEKSWVSDVGDPVEDKSGRKRRQRVYFREDDAGPIPYGAKPRSEGYKRAYAALRVHLATTRLASKPVGPTVAGLCGAYLDHSRRRATKRGTKLKPRTLASLKEALDLWCNWPEDRPHGYRLAAEITAQDVADYMELRVGDRGHYPRRMVGAVLAAWKWARKRDMIPSNPLAEVERPVAPRGTGRRPDREIFRRWLRVSWGKARNGQRHRTVNRVALLLIRALADTGARPEELCLARWEDLDRQLLALAPSDHKTASYDKARMVFFPRRWARALAYLERSGHPTYLFVHGQHRVKGQGAVRLGDEAGEPWNPQALGNWARRWGMPCTRYDLRRLVASELADAGLEYGRIADLLGNSPELVRRTYAKRAAESLRAELDSLPRPGRA